MHIKKIHKNEGEMPREIPHITEEQRTMAERLWVKFNEDLQKNGMDLFYDYDNGCFFVASNKLTKGYANVSGKGDTPEDLDKDELEVITMEGGFGNVVNNPPWFTDGSGYTLRIKK